MIMSSEMCEFFYRVFGHSTADKGPSGFLPWYSRRTLLAAISGAFDGPVGDSKCTIPLSVHAAGEEVRQHIESVRVETEQIENDRASHGNEDAFIVERTDDMIMMAAVDGHVGTEVAHYIQKSAWDEFRSELADIADEMDRSAKIRVALRRMCIRLDAETERICIKVENNIRSKLGGIIEREEWDSKAVDTHSVSGPGAVACFVVLDLLNGEMHTCTVGDCFCMVRRRDGSLWRVTPLHEASNPCEQARIMMSGYSCSFSDTYRIGGLLMPTRVFGDLYVKQDMEEALVCIPAILSFMLDASCTHIVVATDGLSCKDREAEVASTLKDTAMEWMRYGTTHDDRTIVIAELSWGFDI